MYTVEQPIAKEFDDNCVILKIPSEIQFIDFANEIFEWCDINNIDADILKRWHDENTYVAWKITDQKQRIIFMLRWS